MNKKYIIGDNKIIILKIFLIFVSINILFFKCETGKCSTNYNQVKTVIGLGSRVIVDENLATAKDKAINDAIRSSVAEVISAMLTKSDLISNLGIIYDKILSNPQKYIVTYRVLNEIERENQYIVAVESKIDSNALNSFFTDQGILNKKNKKPRILLLISEQAPGEILPRYWWGKNPLPYESITEKVIENYLISNNICEIVGNGDDRPNPADLGIVFKSIHDSDAAIKLGLEAGADIVVIGSAQAKETLNTMGDEKSYEADVSLKIFKTKTGEEITPIDTKAVVKNTIPQAGIKDGFEKAGILAANKLGEEIKKSLNSQDKGPRTIEITIKGTDYLSSFIMLKRVMNKMDGIEDIQTKELGSDQAVADIIFQGNARKLADALMLQTFDSFGIEISDVKDNSLTIKFVPVNNNKPVSKSDIEAAHISE